MPSKRGGISPSTTCCPEQVLLRIQYVPACNTAVLSVKGLVVVPCKATQPTSVNNTKRSDRIGYVFSRERWHNLHTQSRGVAKNTQEGVEKWIRPVKNRMDDLFFTSFVFNRHTPNERRPTMSVATLDGDCECRPTLDMTELSEE